MRSLPMLALMLFSTAATAGMTTNYTTSPQQRRDNEFNAQKVEELRVQNQKLDAMQAQQQEQIKALVNIQAIQTEQLRQQQIIINLLQAQVEAQNQANAAR